MIYSLPVLYPIAAVLVVGVVVSFLANRLKAPVQLFLLLIAIALSSIGLRFSRQFTVAVTVLALVMVVFDAFSRARLHFNDSYAQKAWQLTGFFVGLVILVFSIVMLATGLTGEPLFALIAASLLAGISLPLARTRSARMKQLLETEASFNEALVLFLALALLQFMLFTQTTTVLTTKAFHFAMFALELVVGIGAGLLLGLIVFRIFSRLSKQISPGPLLAVCLGAYVLAELLNGAGIFAVIALSLLFGMLTVKGKRELYEFSPTFSSLVEIFVFMLLGIIVAVPLTTDFLIASVLLFFSYLALRYILVNAVFKEDFKEGQLWLLTLAPSKGLFVAVLCLAAVLTSEYMLPLVQYAVAFLVYGQIASWLARVKA
jgi:cell volume regulation protein A